MCIHINGKMLKVLHQDIIKIIWSLLINISSDLRDAAVAAHQSEGDAMAHSKLTSFNELKQSCMKSGPELLHNNVRD